MEALKRSDIVQSGAQTINVSIYDTVVGERVNMKRFAVMCEGYAPI